jgi:hypothetical protein
MREDLQDHLEWQKKAIDRHHFHCPNNTHGLHGHTFHSRQRLVHVSYGWRRESLQQQRLRGKTIDSFDSWQVKAPSSKDAERFGGHSDVEGRANDYD